MVMSVLERFFLYFIGVFRAPQILIVNGKGSGLALLALFLILAVSLIFLCDWLVRKFNLGFAAGVILTLLILSLAVGLTGLFMSIPSLGNAAGPFLIVGSGSPVFNIVLSVIASLGNRLKKKYPKAGGAILCGVGFLFASALATTFVVFFYALYNY